MLILYLPRKVVTFKGFMDSFVEGFKMMIPAIAILIFAWSLKGMGDALEISTFVKNIVGSNTSASVILPAILFVVAVFLSFQQEQAGELLQSWFRSRSQCSRVLKIFR